MIEELQELIKKNSKLSHKYENLEHDDLSMFYAGKVIAYTEILRVLQNQFKPCAIYYEGMDQTEVILQDCLIVWNGQFGYSSDGALVGVKFSGDKTCLK